MKRTGAIVLLAAVMLLSGCTLIVRPPVPIEQRKDYRQEYTIHGGEGTFYPFSRLLIVSAMPYYRVRIVKNGIPLPTLYPPMYDNIDLRIKNVVDEDVLVDIVVVAYGWHGQVIGTVERQFRFNGNGHQQVEQWVIHDYMLR